MEPLPDTDFWILYDSLWREPDFNPAICGLARWNYPGEMGILSNGMNRLLQFFKLGQRSSVYLAITARKK